MPHQYRRSENVDDVLRPIYKEAGDAIGRDFPIRVMSSGRDDPQRHAATLFRETIDLPLGKRLFVLASFALLAVATVSPALGEDAIHEDASSHEEVHEFHRNWAALFIGVTSEERRNGKPALGVEYARHLNPAFAIDGIVEYTFGDHDFWVVAVPFAYRTGPWKVYVAPGFEIEELRDGPSDSEFLLRIGGEYAFEIGELEIAPQIDVDFVDDETVLIFGVTIGKSF